MGTRHRATERFWRLYGGLPANVRAVADKAFDQLKSNPGHPSLNFKRIGPFWSARVGLHYRALAEETSDGFTWLWIGTHADYDVLLNR